MLINPLHSCSRNLKVNSDISSFKNFHLTLTSETFYNLVCSTSLLHSNHPSFPIFSFLDLFNLSSPIPEMSFFYFSLLKFHLTSMTRSNSSSIKVSNSCYSLPLKCSISFFLYFWKTIIYLLLYYYNSVLFLILHTAFCHTHTQLTLEQYEG